MPVSFVDELMAFISTPANLGTLISSTGMAAFAGTSLARKYGQNGFQVDSVVLGTPVDFDLQELVLDDPRIMGTEQRTDCPSARKVFDLRYHQQQPIGWVDAAFTVPADFNAHILPGSAVIGPAAGVQQNGMSFGPGPSTIQSKFLLSLTTDSFTLSYPLRVRVFASADLSPTADLRRIREVRQFLEGDPAFLASLDGPPNQRPLLFAQIYSGTAADGAPITKDAVVQMFDADDILAAFFTVPS
jgi:hypothetical protein